MSETMYYIILGLIVLWQIFGLWLLGKKFEKEILGDIKELENEQNK